MNKHEIFINSHSAIINVLNSLDTLLWDSAVLMAKHFTDELYSPDYEQFSDFSNKIDNKKLNVLYKYYMTGWAFSPVDKTLMQDIMAICLCRRKEYLEPEKSDHTAIKNLARLHCEDLWPYINAIRQDYKLPTQISSIINFVSKIVAVKTQTDFYLSSNLSDLISNTFTDICFNKTNFNINFRDEDTLSLESAFVFSFAFNSFPDSYTYFKSKSHMAASFIDCLTN